MKEQGTRGWNRRQFIKGAVVLAAAVPALPLGFAVLRRAGAGQVQEAGGTADLFWKTRIAPAEEPGEPLLLSGTVFQPDGLTPAAGVTLYVYHTDARGYYSDQDGAGGPPRPRLKGRMKTDADGRYEFRTIKPAPYPGGRNPAHMHASLSAQGYAERWVEEYWFEGDHFITAEMRARVKGVGRFSPILSLRRGGDGLWRAERDLKL